MSKTRPRKQVAALPIIYDETGSLRVMLITSRETKRLVVPKGWPMKGRTDPRSAAIEARQEAGLKGRIGRKAIGSYDYWKRRSGGFTYCRVSVFVFKATGQLIEWDEKGQRQGAWLLAADAAVLVDDPGLSTIISNLSTVLPRKRKRPSRRR